MTDEEGEVGSPQAGAGPSLPHTPPMGIKAVHPGDEPPVAPTEPTPSPRRRERPPSNWLAALVASGGVVAAIIGTFLPWRVVDHENGFVTHLIGWDQAGDAVPVLIVGLAAAGVTGALWTGLRGLLPKLMLLVTGAVLVVLTGLQITDIMGHEQSEGFAYSVGIGLPVIAVGGLLLVLAALFDRGPWALGSARST